MTNIGPYAQNERNAGEGVRATVPYGRESRPLQHYAMPDGVCTDRPCRPPDSGPLWLLYPLRVPLYCPDSLAVLVWLSRPVIVGNVCRPPESNTPFWPYQPLPYPVLAELEPLGHLVWSPTGLPTVTMAWHVPDDAFWLVWILLPIPTMPRIWVQAYRVPPLPTVTTAATGLTIDPDL